MSEPQGPPHDAAEIDKDQQERLDEAFKQLEHIYRLRGEIVSRVNELEGSIDASCARYFRLNPNDPLYGEFNSWVLGRINFSAKLEIMAAITEKRGVAAIGNPILARVRAANNIRNNIAHSHVTFDIPDDAVEVGVESLLRHRSVRVSRQGRSNVLTSMEELQRDRDMIADLEIHLVALMLSVSIPREDMSAAEHLNEFYELNPELKETRPK